MKVSLTQISMTRFHSDKSKEKEIAMSESVFPPPEDTFMPIFVFGSNEAGIHGAGAAAHAHRYLGAVYGVGVGLANNTYAIPTKDRQIKKLPYKAVQAYIEDFLKFAAEHPKITFQVTQIGCGLAGFSRADIAPLFTDAPENCWFDSAWKPWLPDANFWGTHP
jgi:hypothetical protein